ncbi:MAG: phospholipid/cholesterol/gamma-HCH transport system substrate-binding protein [Actinomycetota bacterium]
MRATLVKLGLFVAMCLSITVLLAFTIGNIQSLRIGPVQLLDDSYKLSATFDDVTGLLVNDNVKVAGVKIGKVTAVKVLKGKARVTMRVKHQLKLPSDTTATIRWRNLLGQRYLYLEPGTASTTLASGGEIAKTRSVVDLGELLNRLGPIVSALDPAKVNEFLDTIVGALNGNEAKVSESIDNLSKLAATLGDRDEAIGRLVGNVDTVAAAVADRDAEIRQVLDNLSAITKTFNDNTNVLDNAVVQLSDFNGHLANILGDNRTQIDSIISNLTTVVGTVGAKLPTLDHIVGNLDDAAMRLANVSRYGEWLDQNILCARIGYPPTPMAETPCIELPTTNVSPMAGRNTKLTRGATAVRQLMTAVH